MDFFSLNGSFGQSNRGVNMETRFDGLCEFVSRRGRMRILTRLLEELKTPTEIAKRLNITRNAVYGWLNEKKRHPSNEHVCELLKILNNENEERFREILVEELQIFQKLIFEF
ncbi:hypothetical protein AKJ39_00385 [candidate division MSBL1 archaeon SCGC-AAA259J03]|uniref:Uncharacterized protein n=1 Tax=candidate division MSBL1 archaeon SCGC-AAA259J03 TaxID=1698269 RepID=A0A656YXC8_9EURY|nr:hypothetical protein AKJ39_00385 [candidate division MSBL1 archaeon SCGC-AAA259J03]